MQHDRLRTANTCNGFANLLHKLHSSPEARPSGSNGACSAVFRMPAIHAPYEGLRGVTAPRSLLSDYLRFSLYYNVSQSNTNYILRLRMYYFYKEQKSKPLGSCNKNVKYKQICLCADHIELLFKKW
jgi:hypothetical protein